MKIGVISDIHDHLNELDQALDIFKKQQVAMILNGGDWVSPYTLKYFDTRCQEIDLVVPVKSVFGNNKGDIKKMVEINTNLKNPIQFAPRFIYELKVEEKNIAIFHGHDSVVLRLLIESKKYELIVTGHTHQIRNEMIGDTLVLNPGSLSKARSSKKVETASVAIYNTQENQAEIISFS